MRLPFVSPIFLLCTLAALGLCGCNAAHPYSAPPPDPAPPAARRPDTDRARAANAHAVTLIGEKKYDEAARVLGDALAADVAFGPAHNSLGTVYFRQSKFYLAAWEFQYAAKLMPYQSEPRNNLGLVFEHVGKMDEAVAWFQRAKVLEPENPVLIGNLARARVRRGDHDDDVRELLVDLVSKDARVEWVEWAKDRLALMKHALPGGATTLPSGG